MSQLAFDYTQTVAYELRGADGNLVLVLYPLSLYTSINVFSMSSALAMDVSLMLRLMMVASLLPNSTRNA